MNKNTFNLNKDIKIFDNIYFLEKNNGLKVVAEEISNSFPFSLSISILSGSRDEINVPNGTAHFLEHILFRRTKRLKSKQIAKEFERYGAIANAFTTKEYTSYFVTANQSNFEKISKLLYEVVFRPEFNLGDIEKERKIIIDEIISSEEDPEDVLNDKVAEQQFPKNNISRPIAGTIESVNEIGLKDIEVFYKNHYVASNIIISYSGPDVENFLKYTDGIVINSDNRIKSRVDLEIAKTSKIEINTNITSQTHLTISYIVKRNDLEIRVGMALFNIMLSEAMSSRLYQVLRERNGITYNVYSGITNYTDFTELYIYTSFDNKYKGKVIKLIEREFDKIKDKNFSKNEVNIAKELLKTYSILENEGSQNKINNLTRQIMLYNNIESNNDTIKYIEEYSYDNILKLSKEIFDFKKWYQCYLIPD